MYMIVQVDQLTNNETCEQQQSSLRVAAKKNVSLSLEISFKIIEAQTFVCTDVNALEQLHSQLEALSKNL